MSPTLPMKSKGLLMPFVIEIRQNGDNVHHLLYVKIRGMADDLWMEPRHVSVVVDTHRLTIRRLFAN